jgi:RpiR family carbohydrate utilization transcriptional regulator
MSSDFETRYSKLKEHLRESEKKAAEWMMENPRQLINMTITSLAKICGVSESSIVRMSQTMGYSGFREMRTAFAIDTAIGERVGVYITDSLVTEINVDEDIRTIVQKEFTICQQGLVGTLSEFDFDAFSEAIDVIDKGKRVEIHGSGTMANIARHAALIFIETNINCICRTDYVEQIHAAATMSHGDVMIALSNSGELKYILNAASIAKSNGATVIALTSSKTSSLAKMADYSLLAKGGSYILRSENLRHRVNVSNIAYRLIIDCLITGLCLKHPKSAIENMISIQNAHDKYLYSF